MIANPYIGITGAVTVQETEDICNAFGEAGYTLESPYIPMLGFLVSHTTLKGQPTENRRYPPVKELPRLLQATDKRVLTMVHYNTRETSTLADQVTDLYQGIYEEELCRALQLNVTWPEVRQVARIKEKFPDMQIVLQASQAAMKDKTSRTIAQKIKGYGNVISYVLIDPSGGRGKEFDEAISLLIYQSVRKECPHVRIGFAGGFTGENIAERVKRLEAEIKGSNFCVDAEGGLRDKITSKYGDDVLNMQKVRKYVRSASTVLR